MRLLGLEVAAQAAAQFQPRKLGQQPVDKGPGAPVEQRQRPVPAPGMEHHFQVAMGELSWPPSSGLVSRISIWRMVCLLGEHLRALCLQFVTGL
jgi:hypothetical protein